MTTLIQKNKCLKDYTTLRVGGPMLFFADVDNQADLLKAIQFSQQQKIPWYIIGQGSNILASDTPINKCIIRYTSQTAPVINTQMTTVDISAGYSLTQLIDDLASTGFGGFEELAGIPGTIGGAIAGNAGAYGNNIGSRVIALKIITSVGNLITKTASELTFDYRYSSIKNNGDAIISAKLQIEKKSRAQLQSTIDEKKRDRINKHPDPTHTPTAGSFFRNPTDSNGKRIAAGKLLQEANCHSLTFGNAHLWHSHANIIITSGCANANDVQQLASEMKSRVYHTHGVTLMQEVVYLD